ncbi:MAG: polysaccharide deacetylase family protein [Candidatus Zipacnadales bacterium]
MQSLKHCIFEWICHPAAIIGRLCHSILPRREAVILCYHGVGMDESIHYTDVHYPRDVFIRQMEFVAQNFTVLTVGDIVAYIQEGRPWPRGTIVITFDDSYASVYKTAWPILQELGLRATVFVTAGLVDTDQLHWPDEVAECVFHHPGEKLTLKLNNQQYTLDLSSTESRAKGAVQIIYALKELADEDRLAILSELRERSNCYSPKASNALRVCTSAEIQEMHAQGLEIGSHTMTHPILTRIKDDDKLEAELRDSRETLQRIIGAPVNLIAYPDGAYDDRVLAATARAGYQGGVILNGMTVAVNSNPLLLGRICPAGTQSRFQVQVFGLEAKYRALLAMIGWKKR